MELLIIALQQHNLIDEMGNIILVKYPDGSVQSIDQETFSIFFGDSFPDYTYEKLIGPHTFQWNGEPLTKTGEELGYKSYFDQWQVLGIL